MKKIFLICFAAMAVVMVPQTMSAQGLFGKINKGLQKVNSSLDKASDKASVATGQATQQENGVLVMNPISKVVSIELVKAIGRSTSENFGNVEIVLKVTMKEPETSIAFGGSSSSQQTIAFDGDGNSYKMGSSIWENYDVVEGLPVKITLTGKYAFQKVRKTELLPVVKIYSHIKYEKGYAGEIQFKNVPVTWDPTDEE